MEQVTNSNSDTGTDRELFDRYLIIKGLGDRSLKAILTGSSKDKNLAQQAAEAVGLSESIQVEKSVTINRPAEELYSFWRDFTNLPSFMQHLKSVSKLDEGGQKTHWVANAPLDLSVEWDAEIVREEPNRLIAWSATDADFDNCGLVRFKPAPGDRGTEVKVVLEYYPPGGALTNAFAKLFGESPQQQIGDELNRFKQIMETGEITTTEGQPQGG